VHQTNQNAPSLLHARLLSVVCRWTDCVPTSFRPSCKKLVVLEIWQGSLLNVVISISSGSSASEHATRVRSSPSNNCATMLSEPCAEGSGGTRLRQVMTCDKHSSASCCAKPPPSARSANCGNASRKFYIVSHRIASRWIVNHMRVGCGGAVLVLPATPATTYHGTGAYIHGGTRTELHGQTLPTHAANLGTTTRFARRLHPNPMRRCSYKMHDRYQCCVNTIEQCL
jgi:hypothetical protein